MALPVLGPAGDEGDGPATGHHCAEADQEPRPPEPRRTEGERQCEGDHGNEIPGHCLAIGPFTDERELGAPLAEDRAERVFPDTERFVELALRDDERHEHADAVRVDP